MPVDARGFVDSLREFVGQRVIGVLVSALPLIENAYHKKDSKTLVFEDGRGLTISVNGICWIDTADDVSMAISNRASELADIIVRSQREYDELRAVVRK